MCVHDEGQVTSGVESLFDAAKDQGAEGIGEIKDQDSDGAAVAAAQRAGGGIGVVPEGLGRLPDKLLGGGSDVPGEGSVIEYDGDGGGREPTLACHIHDALRASIGAGAWLTSPRFLRGFNNHRDSGNRC